jgi:hypothetical protein
MEVRKIFLLAVVLSLFAAAPGTLRAQSQTDTPAVQPATASAPAGQAQSPTQPKAKPVKVWDNDQINALSNDHGVSVVGAKATPGSAATATKALAPDKDPAWYRKQLQPLQAEIDKLDGQIAKLQAFLKGEAGGNAPSPHPQLVPTPQDQLKQLEEKRAKDVDKVNDLLDRARHNNIPPGELR